MIFAVLLIIVVLSVLYAIWRKNKHVRLLMEEYERALQGSDKKLALIAGRKYYQALRGYKTILHWMSWN